MDLWIRRQDRQKLVKVKTIEILDHYANNTKEYMHTAININGEEFASYKSKERALEVLNEIQAFLIIDDSDFDKEGVCGIYHNVVASKQVIIYEMPKE